MCDAVGKWWWVLLSTVGTSFDESSAELLLGDQGTLISVGKIMVHSLSSSTVFVSILINYYLLHHACG